MKIIFRIFVILVVSAIVCAGFFAVVETTNQFTRQDMPGIGSAQQTEVDGMAQSDMPQPEFDEKIPGSGERNGFPGADHHKASFSNGLISLLTIVAKISGVATLVILIQTGFSVLRRRGWKISRVF